ncbi:unnamed protein product [Durusdinium trenchii]|uniref:Uncharacterized protein n=2 Tax=Durusdinium trenchii TaxID=1381693 RepID=A0ABP0QW23_9DINO
MGKKDAKKVKKKSKKDKKKKSKKANKKSSSSSEEASSSPQPPDGRPMLASGIAQELRAALLRKQAGEAAELSAQRDDALGRRDARALAVARPVALAGEQLSEAERAEREALQKEAEDLLKHHREMRLKSSAP